VLRKQLKILNGEEIIMDSKKSSKPTEGILPALIEDIRNLRKSYNELRMLYNELNRGLNAVPKGIMCPICGHETLARTIYTSPVVYRCLTCGNELYRSSELTLYKPNKENSDDKNQSC
jgi:hypothetical protein